MKSVGVFGGTFDPVHYGHLRAALEARDLLDIDDFRLLPSGNPPHRPAPGADALHRLEMVKQAVAGHSGFRVDDREVHREGRSWMVDTLSEIRAEEGRVSLVLMIGQDAASELDSWHRWEDLFDLAHLVIMSRPESKAAYSSQLQDRINPRLAQDAAELKQSTCGRVLPLEITQLDIASTAIRNMIAAGRSPGFLLPDAVIHYIREHGLYAAANDFAAPARKG